MKFLTFGIVAVHEMALSLPRKLLCSLAAKLILDKHKYYKDLHVFHMVGAAATPQSTLESLKGTFHVPHNIESI